MRSADRLSSKFWTPARDQVLRNCYAVLPQEVIAGLLGIETYQVISRVRILRLTKSVRQVEWSSSEKWLLRELYPDLPSKDIAALLDRELSAIYRMATKLGLEKSEEFKASVHSGRVQRGYHHPNMVAHRFPKGIVPWNKGTHFASGGRSIETRFKKGEMRGAAQRNYKPIGTLRICSKDGYLQRKITDDPTIVGARRWEAEHRLVWIRHNGPIPPGHIVAFKPGKFTAVLEEITVDRLECISMAQNLARNRWQNNPTLKALIPLKSQITRHVNRINREAKERSAA